MTEQITNIEAELQTCEVDLFNASTEYRQLAEDAARKRSSYDVAWAQQLLKLKSDTDLKATVPEREALATVAVQDQMTGARIAEAMADASKRHLVTMQSVLSSIQTRARLIQTESFTNGRQA